MAAQPQHDFSFDVYPGLDLELDQIYARNVEAGVATPEAVASGGLATAVGSVLNNPNTAPGSPDTLSPDVHTWVQEELSILKVNGGRERWRRYNQAGVLTSPLPDEISDLVASHPDMEQRLTKLFEAKQILTASGELTPNGENIGENMHLVFIPWQTFRDNLARLPDHVGLVRSLQGKTTQDDYFNEELLATMQSNTPMYRDPYSNAWIPAAEYLDRRIDRDGEWGVMLVQTSERAGLKRIVEGPPEQRTPDAMTNDGHGRFEVDGVAADSLGIFEWLSLSYQENPLEISPEDYSWMLANRFDVGGRARVPAGYFRGGQVRSYLGWAGNQGEAFRARLAVI